MDVPGTVFQFLHYYADAIEIHGDMYEGLRPIQRAEDRAEEYAADLLKHMLERRDRRLVTGGDSELSLKRPIP